MPASLVVIGNEHPDARLERKTIRPHSVISSYVTGAPEIQIQILVPHIEMHPVTTFVAPTPASSVSEGVHYGRPALSDKIMGISKIRFQISVPHPEKHQSSGYGYEFVVGVSLVQVLVPLKTHGRVSLGVNVMDSWLMCHEFKLSTAEEPPCRGSMHYKSIRAQTYSCWSGVEVKRWGRPRHFTMVQDYEIHCQKPSSS
ncbi:hypothetical protein TNCV_5079131 [Trichonephila clavipes]|nr:hypothetical protein TNCV_5079131 [Trichonephila clavipes]